MPSVLFQNGEVECSFTPCPELDCPREEWWLGPGQCCFTCRESTPMTGEGPQHPCVCVCECVCACVQMYMFMVLQVSVCLCEPAVCTGHVWKHLFLVWEEVCCRSGRCSRPPWHLCPPALSPSLSPGQAALSMTTGLSFRLDRSGLLVTPVSYASAR